MSSRLRLSDAQSEKGHRLSTRKRLLLQRRVTNLKENNTKKLAWAEIWNIQKKQTTCVFNSSIFINTTHKNQDFINKKKIPPIPVF